MKIINISMVTTFRNSRKKDSHCIYKLKCTSFGISNFAFEKNKSLIGDICWI